MNYIELVNKFWSIDLEANFSHLEVHLFFKLLEINNKLGWKESFRFPNTRLEGEIGSRTKNLIQARQRLSDFGLVSYKKGTTRDAGIYSFNSFVATKESNKESKNGSNKGTNEKVITEVIRGTLNKQNKTKQEIPLNPHGGNIDVSKKNVKEKKEFDLSFVDVVYISIVKDFIDYRKQIKKPFKTEKGVEMFYSELLKLSGNNLQKAQKLVEYAKGKEWQTVYELKDDTNTNNSGDRKQSKINPNDTSIFAN